MEAQTIPWMAPKQVLICDFEVHQPLKCRSPATPGPFLPPLQALEAEDSSKTVFL